jgi:Phosphoribosyl transferase domain
VVLALPRGGVPVVYEVSKALGAPLRSMSLWPGSWVFRATRSSPWARIASGGLLVLDESLVRRLGIGREQLERAIAAESRELERREAAYGDGRGPPDLEGKSVILVDDGLATDATMRAAALAVRRLNLGGSSLPCRSPRSRPAISSAMSSTRSSATSHHDRFEPSAPGTTTSRRRLTTRYASS